MQFTYYGSPIRSEFYIQHETNPWSVIVFSYGFERSFFGDADLYWDEPPVDRLLHVSPPMVDYSL